MVNLRRQFLYNVRPGTVLLHAEIAIGSGGSPTLTTASGKGIKSVSRTGTGALTVNLDEPYLGLIHFGKPGIEGASLVDAYGVQLAGEWVAGVSTVNETNGIADGYVKLLCHDGYGNAADLISHTIWLDLACATSEQGT